MSKENGEPNLISAWVLGSNRQLYSLHMRVEEADFIFVAGGAHRLNRPVEFIWTEGDSRALEMSMKVNIRDIFVPVAINKKL